MDRVEPNIDMYPREAYQDPRAMNGNVYHRGRRSQRAQNVDEAHHHDGYDERAERHSHNHDYDHDDYGYEDDYDADYRGHARFGIIDRILAAPGKWLVGGLTAAAFAVVGVNAAFMQPGAHPSPMVSTRAAAPAEAIPASRLPAAPNAITSAPAPIVPPDRVISQTASISTDQQQVLNAQTSISATRVPYAAPSPVPRPTVAPTQTVAAAPTEPILQPSSGPVPPAPVQAQQTPQPRPVQTIAVDDPIGALLAPTASSSQPLPQAAVPNGSGQVVVAAVQAVLADMGYSPGSIDGVVGPSTEEAIRRFQLLRALEPNGQITAELLREIERVSGTQING